MIRRVSTDSFTTWGFLLLYEIEIYLKEIKIRSNVLFYTTILYKNAYHNLRLKFSEWLNLVDTTLTFLLQKTGLSCRDNFVGEPKDENESHR